VEPNISGDGSRRKIYRDILGSRIVSFGKEDVNGYRSAEELNDEMTGLG
jgi:hypothetical protein